ncbi:MAG: phage major capsid protein [Paracoccaceae bacterium]
MTGTDPTPHDTHHDDADAMSAVTTLARDVEGFARAIGDRLAQQEDRMTLIDRKTRATARITTPGAPETAAEAAPHGKAMAAYLRSGDDDGFRGLELDQKGMTTAVAADGGYLVDPQMADTISSRLASTASLRAVAAVVQVDAGAYEVLIDETDAGAGWTDEGTATAETGAPIIDRITIPLHELSACPKASQRLLDDAAFDVEGWLAGRVAAKFARSEAAAFVTGDGVDKPRGILDYPVVDEASWSWGSLGAVDSGAAGAFADGGDALIDLVYALGADYRANASFVMNSRTAGAVRKLKDADGRHLWADGLAEGQPARLLGYRVVVCEDMPDMAAGSVSIAFGDFGQGYTIAERPDLRMLRDPFSAKPNVLFYATRRVGGAVTDFAAIKVMRFQA